MYLIPKYPQGFVECHDLSKIDFRSIQSTQDMYAEPIPYSAIGEHFNENENGNEQAAFLTSYCAKRQQEYGEEQVGPKLTAILTKNCKIINDVIKTTIVNCRIQNMEQLKMVLPDVVAEIDKLREGDQREIEIGILNEIFAAVK